MRLARAPARRYTLHGAMTSKLHESLWAHRDLLWSVCYKMLGSAADADDALQATFEKVLLHPPPDASLPLRPWLLRIAVNHCRDELRKRRTRSAFWLPGPLETPLDDPRFVGIETPDARYSRMESVSLAFMVALHTLTPLQRAALILRDVLDLSVREAALALETSEGNVKMALHRARAQLAKSPVQASVHGPETELRVLQALLVHLATHNTAALTELLVRDVTLCNDADPDQVAAHRLVVGRDKVLRFHFKTARVGGRMALRIMNGKPALVAELPPKRAPSSGRPIGQAAPGRSLRFRELPRRVVLWVELNAAAQIVALHAQTSRDKLAGVAFDQLTRPSLRQLGDALWAAMHYPHHSQWRRSACGRGLLALASGARLRGMAFANRYLSRD